MKGKFHAKVSTIKDTNGKDLTEAEEVKKRWQEYTEELYKKGLNDPDNHNGVVTHLELDIPECEVKWALKNITTNKASGGVGIAAELFQILKDDAIKVLHSLLSANLESSAVAPGLEKDSFHSNPKKGNAKECSKYCTIVHISYASKFMLKILQVKFQLYVNQELPDVQAGFIFVCLFLFLFFFYCSGFCHTLK